MLGLLMVAIWFILGRVEDYPGFFIFHSEIPFFCMYMEHQKFFSSEMPETNFFLLLTIFCPHHPNRNEMATHFVGQSVIVR